MESFKMIATALMLLTIFSLCEASSSTLHQFKALANYATTTDQNFNNNQNAELCHARDISITQGQVSKAGIPTWQVLIINMCSNPRCVISQVIVQCGAFHSATAVNPHIFRSLDEKAGTCIVNDGNKIGNGQTVTFRYSDSFEQRIPLSSGFL